jgi:branched-subunit amino acid transport protein
MKIWLIFILAAIGTYAIRVSGLALFRDEDRMPPVVRRALRMIGPAAMGAIVGSSLLLDHGVVRPFGAWHVAAIVAIGFAAWKRNLALTMLAGAAVFAVLLVVEGG